MPQPAADVVQICQIVVRRLFETDNVYVFQNSDGRLIFASPYERDFTLIGTVDHGFTGDPAVVTTSAGDIAYLCEAANRYFRERIGSSDVVRTRVRRQLVMAAGASRDGGRCMLRPPPPQGAADHDVRRRRHDRAAARGTGRLLLTPFYPMSPRWTAKAPLPGGDFAWDRFDAQVEAARERWGFLAEAEAQRLVGAYGTRIADVLGEARSRADLGPRFGTDLTAAEVRYLMTQGMGALSRRYPVAAHQARADHVAARPRGAGGVHGGGALRSVLLKISEVGLPPSPASLPPASREFNSRMISGTECASAAASPRSAQVWACASAACTASGALPQIASASATPAASASATGLTARPRSCAAPHAHRIPRRQRIAHGAFQPAARIRRNSPPPNG